MSLIIPGFYGLLGTGTSSSRSFPLRKDLDEVTAGSGDDHSGSLWTRNAWSALDPESGVRCCITGTPHWRDRRLNDLQLNRDPAIALLKAYEIYGEALLQELLGRFSVVVDDTGQRHTLIATDRFGRDPVYWRRAGSALAFAPTANAVLELLDSEVKLNSQAIYGYLFFHMVPAPLTAFEGIEKLPAANKLSFKDGQPRVERYWQPTFTDDVSIKGQGAQQTLKVIESSVARLIDGTETGAFLSGGLDSSTVAGMLARQSRETPANTYSIGFDAEGYDETKYARIAARHFGTNHHEYYVTPEDVLEALPKVASAYDEPFGNSSAIPAYFCAQMAKADGRTRLLAGDGGDELFAGNERYAKQSIFELYKTVPRAFRKYLLEPAISVMPETGFTRKVGSYVDQANIPLPDRLQTYNFFVRHDPKTILGEDFIDSINPAQPIELQREIFASLDNADLLNRMLYLDWQHTLADNDLRKVTRMCQLAGIEVEYPLLDDYVVNFSTAIPSREKLRRNQLRYFYKKAVTGFLPDEIINKSKHGFGLPFGVWMSTHAGLQELSMDSLQKMRDRRIIRASFIEELLDLHRQQHSGYYGELVWVLVMLELWFDSHGL